ncbi:AAA family ATPase [Roseibium album]|uniref:Exodeoxyribonuclease V alpha chain n=1 Tax=Roseibium album TaxID=311410 RepID=A0A0M6Z7T1_9HYPH|nr:AAA family ATPase [Roseibium album]CTQ58132.1 Exodeoxyribonuclease V alpha chain [Roseibium album]CTQ65642.1 Exodeoxyribonuclease V alpha chain [Roseibium album]CTQ70519.1 Exodeoxyribonuclease V alpha chain [Roseibium album]
MILKGNQRGSGRNLALHLLNVDDNEHATVHELRGFLASDLIGAFKEAEAVSLGTKCQQYLFSLSLNPPISAKVSVAEFELTIEKIEKKLGLTGQPRAIVFHEKKGRRHAHCVWSRIDVQNMRAINHSHYKRKLFNISQELFRENGWELPKGFQNKDQSDESAYSFSEAGQAKRAKRDPSDLKHLFKNCLEQSDSLPAFAAALKEQGFCIARGDRRGYVAVDYNGEVYSLSRWCGVKAKELRARFGDPDNLPTVHQALDDLNRHYPPTDASTSHRHSTNEIFEKQLAELVVRQHGEREALVESHEQRRLVETKARNKRLPSGFTAIWARLTGQLTKAKEALSIEAQLCRSRDRLELQSMIDRHLTERRSFARSFVQTNILVELQQEFGDETASASRQLYQPDPLQPLVLPPDDAPFTKEEIRKRPDLILDVLSDRKAQFSRSDILSALADVIDDPQELRIASSNVLSSAKLCSVSSGIRNTFTTKDFVATQARLLNVTSELAASGGFAVRSRLISKAIEEENTQLQKRFGAALSNEQVAAIKHVLKSNQLSCVVGLAGSGKSTLLSVARKAWEKQGYRVHGASLAGKAADSLHNASGIPSRTLASLEASWKSGYEPVGHGDILVVDEAGMVGTRQLERIASGLKARGCKLVLVGDPQQLQPIEAGTPFKTIAETTGASRLTEIRRQKHGWQRTASKAFAIGDTETAMQAYQDHCAVHSALDRDHAIAELVEDYVSDFEENRPDSSRLALAHRRKDVHALNQAIKSALRQVNGAATEFLLETDHGPRAFCVGDRILFTRNNATLGVRNGMLGSITKASDKQLSVQLDAEGSGNRSDISFSPQQFQSFDHGYAVSIHRSQGCTLDRSFVLSSRTLDDHLTYVAMTRHKESVKFYSAPDIARRISISQCQSDETPKQWLNDPRLKRS